MQLTQFTDYSIRVLIYLSQKDDIATVQEISSVFGVSKNHLIKVVHKLSQAGLIHSYKGKKGGIEIAEQSLSRRLGDLIAQIEPQFHIVECFDKVANTCPIVGVCFFEKALYEALQAFFNSLNEYSLKDITKGPNTRILRQKLGLAP